MYEIMTADEAIRLIRDGDCICVNSFVGIENPIELHEAIYRRYQKMQSPTHLTMISSAGCGVWDDEHNAEGYIREGYAFSPMFTLGYKKKVSDKEVFATWLNLEKAN